MDETKKIYKVKLIRVAQNKDDLTNNDDDITELITVRKFFFFNL